MTTHNFDTIVVGSGTSAYFAIMGLNKAGQSVAVVDERDYGGTCALRGCQPKKYLVANAEAVAQARHLLGNGVDNDPQTNWADLQKLKNAFLDGIPEGEVKEFQEAGIATFFGKARFAASDEIEIDGKERLKAKNIVLATGATPRVSKIPGSEHAKDSEHFLNMSTLPKRILFVGGGYISFEFAHVAATAGAEVTVLHRSDRPLKAFEKDMVDIILQTSKAMGINVVLNESPVEIRKSGDGYTIVGHTGKSFSADLVIEASGRVPNLSVLEGDLGNVESSNRGVTVDQHLQSVSNPRVYAIGDCAATPYQLAPVADAEGKIAAQNILNGNQESFDASIVPTAVFTLPNIGAVGLTEEQAKEKGLDFRINKGTTTGWPSSKRIGEKHSAYKILISNEDETIIGAHLARHNAPEVINIFALAMKHGIKASELANFPWAYPTYSSDLKYMVR